MKKLLTATEIRVYHHAIERLMAIIARSPKQEYMQDPNACALYLTRTRWFLDLIGNPEKRIPHYVHVTGTSGKGSTAAMMHDVLRATGARVASTFSPHPTTFIERIRVNEQFISVPEFIRIATRLERYLTIAEKKSPHGMVSFFELMHCFTMVYFAQKKVDWAVVEVGCGGRYCATNTIPTPDITIITNVGLDHTQILGNRRAKIAWEKAGIIKKGTTLITGESDPRILKVFAQQCAIARPKKILHPGTVRVLTSDETGTRFVYKKQPYTLPVIGAHQTANAALVIEAAHQLHIPDDTIRTGFLHLTRPVCMERMSDEPLILLDGAHNRDKMRTTRDALRLILRTRAHGRVYLLIGIASDKKHAQILRLIAPLADHITTTEFTPSEHKRPEPAATLGALARIANPRAQVRVLSDALSALRTIQKEMTTDDILLITGSIYLAGALRSTWIPESQILATRRSTP